MSSPIDFAIVDAHIHQWDPTATPHEAALLVKLLGRYPQWMDRVVRCVKPKSVVDTFGVMDFGLAPYLPSSYSQDCGEVLIESIVHVEARWHEQKGVGPANETRWIDGLPFPEANLNLGAIVGGADPRLPHFAQLLDAHLQSSDKFRGIRRMASVHEDPGVMDWCEKAGMYASQSFLQGFELLAAKELSFDAWTYSTQLSEILVLAKQFPDAPIVIDHLATPAGIFGPVGRFTGRSERARASIMSHWKDAISEFSDKPQVYAKLSGLMMPVLGHRFHSEKRMASRDEVVNLLSPLIEHAMAVFGEDRLMFASNFPMDKVSTRFSDLIAAYTQILAPYGREALIKIFKHNAQRFYAIAC